MEEKRTKFLYTQILIIEFSTAHFANEDGKGSDSVSVRDEEFVLFFAFKRALEMKYTSIKRHCRCRRHSKALMVRLRHVTQCHCRCYCSECFMEYMCFGLFVCLFVQNIFVLNFKYCHIFNGNRKQRQQ